MIQGTSSHVGKSVLVTALCRIFAQDGYRVAPFKSWNMSLNSSVTLDGGEIGRSQGEQAEAAGIEATVHMNPILVKPQGRGQSQVIVQGRVHGAVDYGTRSDDNYLRFCLGVISDSLAILKSEYDIIVIEGAGSPAEINLMSQDVANMKVAHLAEAPVLLVSDIERGGALAAVVGTMLLLPERDRERIAGFIFNKFRGDKSLLEPGLTAVEKRTGRPVLGVVPSLSVTRPAEEDGVALEGRSGENKRDGERLRLCVVRLTHISNFTDLDALAAERDVAMHYVGCVSELRQADAVIIPGSKNTVLDNRFLSENGFVEEIRRLSARGVPVVGICGGYQLLGKRLNDPDGNESGGTPVSLEGLGLLDTETTFYAQKTVTRVTAIGLLPFAMGEEVEGYEIHMGQTVRLPGCRPAFRLQKDGREVPDGAVCASGSTWGTYLHGVFDRPCFRRAWLNSLRRMKGWGELSVDSTENIRGARFDELAGHVRQELKMDEIYNLIGLAGPKEVQSLGCNSDGSGDFV
jgi:adenosylcobyric acid synthase